MSSNSFSSVLTNGVQDISALLPLLGTEQCESHVTSALTNGYLYAAATPMSLFGSLGLARAGIKALLSCTPLTRWGMDGARMLKNAGFQSPGVNLSLTMLDKKHDDRILAERRLESFLKDLHLDPTTTNLSVSCKPFWWNIKMVFLTAGLSAISAFPYVYLNLRSGSNISNIARWIYPAIRAAGGFLTATMIQLLIQRRLLILAKSYLAIQKLDSRYKPLGIQPKDLAWVDGDSLDRRLMKLNRYLSRQLDRSPAAPALSRGGNLPIPSFLWTAQQPNDPSVVERGLNGGLTGVRIDPDTASAPTSGQTGRHTDDAPDHAKLLQELRQELLDIETRKSFFIGLIYSALLFFGVLGSVAGYIGCFNVVQNTLLRNGPLAWLGFESALAVLRIVLWASNPKDDDAPPLQFTLQLDRHPLLPTCFKDAKDIERDRVLPLIRAEDFLDGVTSYAGLLERFDNEGLWLYYTLTRMDSTPEGRDARQSERVLYITIFDYKERTSRVYTKMSMTQPGEDARIAERLFSAQTPYIDLRHNIMETNLGEEIDPQKDPIMRNSLLLQDLAKHHRSILDQIRDRSDDSDVTDIIENPWTLRCPGTKSTRRDPSGPSLERKQCRIQSAARTESAGSDPCFPIDQRILDFGRFERKRNSLITDRGRWITDYMEWVTPLTIKKSEDQRKIQDLDLRGVASSEAASGHDACEFGLSRNGWY